MKHLSPLRLRIYGCADRAHTAHPVRGGEPLRVSLETALANLERLPRMFVELDGSFLWSGPAAAGHSTGSSTADSAPALRLTSRWQLEGTIYDDGQVVRYIDVRGDCPLDAWKTFLAAFEATLASVTLQLVENEWIVPGQWLEQFWASED